MTLRPWILAAAVIAAGGMPALASAAPGDLDVSFSGDGKQTTDFGGADVASAVAVQADGKLVVAGTSDGNFALARYGVDGALDPSFSGDGLVTTDLGGTDDGQGVAIQADGKIVVVGSSDGNFALARYTAGGGLDPSFSGDGLQTTDFGAADGATAVAIQGDGRIVVGGSSGGDFALARYDAAGELDPSFSGDGKQTTGFGGPTPATTWRSAPTARSSPWAPTGRQRPCGELRRGPLHRGRCARRGVDHRLRLEPIHLRQRRRRRDPGRRPHRRRGLRRGADPVRWLLHEGPAARPLRAQRRARQLLRRRRPAGDQPLRGHAGLRRGAGRQRQGRGLREGRRRLRARPPQHRRHARRHLLRQRQADRRRRARRRRRRSVSTASCRPTASW